MSSRLAVLVRRLAGTNCASGNEEAGALWLPQWALAEMTRQADELAPRETGGVLLGYWDASGHAAVVECVIGPGPLAVHREADFTPDHAYQERTIARLYREANRELEYLGDWHTHPNGPAVLSWKDLSTLRRIARYRPARTTRPIMLLLAGGTQWRCSAWVGELCTRSWWRTGIAARALSLILDQGADALDGYGVVDDP